MTTYFVYRPTTGDRAISYMPPTQDSGWQVVTWNNGSRHLDGNVHMVSLPVSTIPELSAWARQVLPRITGKAPHLIEFDHGYLNVYGSARTVWHIVQRFRAVATAASAPRFSGIHFMLNEELVASGIAEATEVYQEVISQVRFVEPETWTDHPTGLPKAPQDWWMYSYDPCSNGLAVLSYFLDLHRSEYGEPEWTILEDDDALVLTINSGLDEDFTGDVLAAVDFEGYIMGGKSVVIRPDNSNIPGRGQLAAIVVPLHQVPTWQLEILKSDPRATQLSAGRALEYEVLDAEADIEALYREKLADVENEDDD